MEQLLVNLLQGAIALSENTAAYVTIAIALTQVLKIIPAFAAKPKQVQVIIQLTLLCFGIAARKVGYEVQWDVALPPITAFLAFISQVIGLVALPTIAFGTANFAAPIIYDVMHDRGTPGFQTKGRGVDETA